MKQLHNPNKKKTNQNLMSSIGWILAVLFLAGFIYLLNKNHQLDEFNKVTTTQNVELESESNEIKNQLAESNRLLNILRSKEFQTITLMGNQAVAPQSFAKVYLNKKDGLAYIDLKGLPAPPNDKVYQLWSLKMEPFAPTNIGVMDNTSQSGMELYQFSNFPKPEALCITLEPTGGSKTPTMSQIYVLDMSQVN